MKKTHQDAMAEIIYSLLKMPNDLRDALIRGNPFDKLLRSYSEFTSNGESLYRNKRSVNFYPFSVKAIAHYKKYKTLDGLHAEHIVPLSHIKKVLLNDKNWSLLRVKNYLAKYNQVVVITEDEQKLIDTKFKSTMPPRGTSRLDFFKIKKAKSTLNNSLISIS
jgi:hypothetical protein